MKNSLVKYNQNRSLFDELSHSLWNDAWSDPLFGLTRGWRPETYKETDKDYLLEIEIPRVRKNEVKCEAIDSNTVRISVNNKNLQYERQFTFSDCDAEKADIKLEAGVLSVILPKVTPLEPKYKILDIKEVSETKVLTDTK